MTTEAGHPTCPWRNAAPTAGARWTSSEERAIHPAGRNRRDAQSPVASGARDGAIIWNRSATTATASRAAAPTPATARSATSASQQGKVEAIVSGSDLYRVEVKISALKAAKWKKLKQACTGKIGSLIELLQGKLSEEIMSVVTNDSDGLFPRPGEIDYECDCPDWAGMCKHIAAVIYGIGARLDSAARTALPAARRRSRGADHRRRRGQTITGKSGSRRTLSSGSLADVFGIELEDTAAPPKKKRAKAKQSAAKKATKKAAKKRTGARRTKQNKSKDKPFKATARNIAALRRRHGMSKPDFAEVLGVSAATVTRWESTKGVLQLKEKSSVSLAWMNQQEIAT